MDFEKRVRAIISSSGHISGFEILMDHGAFQDLVEIYLSRPRGGDKTAILAPELRRLADDLIKLAEMPSEIVWDDRAPSAE